MRTPVAALILSIILIAGHAYASDGHELISPSTKALARGGADVAVGDSALSQIDNPATLSLATRDARQFDGMGRWAYLLGPYRGLLDHSESEHHNIIISNAAMTFPVTKRLTLGAAAHGKAGLGTRFRHRHLLIPFAKRNVGSDMKIVDLQLNGAYKLTDTLSAGIGVRVEFATAKFSTVIGPVDIDFGRGRACGAGFQLGLYHQASEKLAFGLAYRSPTWYTNLDGGEGTASLLGLFPVRLGEIAVDDFQLPQRAAGGIAWDATNRLKLVGEIRWLNHARGLFHNMTITTDGLIDLRYPFPLGYQDQWIYIIGAECKLSNNWTLGAGYHHGTKPVARANVIPIGSCITRRHATIGLRYDKETWWLGASYIWTLPETLRGNGWSDIPLGIDYGFTEMEQEHHSVAIGFGFRI